MNNIKISDVARKVGCSPGTVSKVLNNKGGIKRETAQHILQVAKQLGYTPNKIAQGLRLRKTNSIALITPELGSSHLDIVAEAIESYCHNKNYRLVLCYTAQNREKEINQIKFAVEHQVDGIIIRPAFDDSLRLLKKTGIPFAVVADSFDSGISYVDIDNIKVGYIVTKHLLDMGYKRIAFVGNSYAYSHRRRKGMEEALREAGIPLRVEYIAQGGDRAKAGYDALSEFMRLKEPPDAVFAARDVMAFGVLHRATELGIKVPEDLGVVGVDDVPEDSLPQISLTTVPQKSGYIGGLMAQILLKKIESPGTFKERQILLEPELIARNSTLRKK